MSSFSVLTEFMALQIIIESFWDMSWIFDDKECSHEVQAYN